MDIQHGNPITILMAEDDPDDRMLVSEAFEESRLNNDLRFVEDGAQIMAYLRHEGEYTEENAPRPAVILLDLNMPKKDGREVLNELKQDPQLQQIPVIVLTTSEAEEDIIRSYCSGAAGFIVKPVTFQRLVDVLKTVGEYWLEIVQLPRSVR
jgi:CheY-like chemotaxis protein